jgi:hypothetical protein
MNYQIIFNFEGGMIVMYNLRYKNIQHPNGNLTWNVFSDTLDDLSENSQEAHKYLSQYLQFNYQEFEKEWKIFSNKFIEDVKYYELFLKYQTIKEVQEMEKILDKCKESLKYWKVNNFLKKAIRRRKLNKTIFE